MILFSDLISKKALKALSGLSSLKQEGNDTAIPVSERPPSLRVGPGLQRAWWSEWEAWSGRCSCPLRGMGCGQKCGQRRSKGTNDRRHTLEVKLIGIRGGPAM